MVRWYLAPGKRSPITNLNYELSSTRGRRRTHKTWTTYRVVSWTSTRATSHEKAHSVHDLRVHLDRVPAGVSALTKQRSTLRCTRVLRSENQGGTNESHVPSRITYPCFSRGHDECFSQLQAGRPAMRTALSLGVPGCGFIGSRMRLTSSR